MSKLRLPKQIEPLRFAEKRILLVGEISLHELPDVSTFIANAQGHVDVELHFDKDEEGVCFIQGKLTTDLQLVCQRCLKVYIYHLVAKVSLSPVRTDEQAKALGFKYEPLLLEDDFIETTELIANEILLNLPLVPMHELENCEVSLPMHITDADEQQPSSNNPFAKLAKLKKSKNSSENDS